MLLPLLIVIIFYTFYSLMVFFLGREDKYKNILKMIKNYSYKPFISIVIPTYNEEKIIASKLDNTLNMDYPTDKVEIIVVDSSNDNTRAIVEEYIKRYSYIKLIKTERKGPADALNKAYSIARGDIVIRTDCDSMLRDNLVSEIVSNFADDSIGAVTSKLVVLNDERLEINYRSIQHKIQIAESRLDSTYIFHSCSAFRRKLIKPITTSADDTDVALNIRKQGYRVIYDPDAIFYETSPLVAKERISVKSRRAVGHINLLLKNINLCFNPKFSWYGMIIFPANIFMMIISPIFMLLIPIFSIIDILIIRKFLLFDYFILVSMLLMFILKNKPIISKIWTVMELQLIQLIALIHVIKYRDVYTWKRAETTREYLANIR